MAIYIIGKLKQKNDGKFALLDAADIEMPDGSRLSDKVFVEKTSELENDSGYLTETDVGEVMTVISQVLDSKVGKTELNGEVKNVVNAMLVPITQAEYDALEANGTVDMTKYYFIKKEEEE